MNLLSQQGIPLATSILCLTALAKPSVAQVTADASLQAENSIISAQVDGLGRTYTVTGGATRGGTLFHSFSEFSILAGETLTFANTDTITNILSRVTTDTASNIDGIIRAGGDANLFVLNPAGIILGPNSKLEIGGSFVASTAEGIRFSPEFIYGTVEPNIPPLLTVSTPIGLVFGDNPGNISILGLTDSKDLTVRQGKTLAFVGEEVSIKGRKLSSNEGRIEVGGITEAGEVGLSTNELGLDLNFNGLSRFGNIQISEQSSLDTSGRRGGEIEIRGKDIVLTEGSSIVSDTQGELDGQEINILADNFKIENGSFLGAATYGKGNGSRINIKATNDVSLTGRGGINFILLQLASLNGFRTVSDREKGGLFTTTTSSGNSGSVTVESKKLSIDQGFPVSTESLGTGKSGNITISNSQTVTLQGSGFLSSSLVPGVILISPESQVTGNSSEGRPAGAAGDITINTAELLMKEGAAISAVTYSDEASGKISINATDLVSLQGRFELISFPTAITNTTVGGKGNAKDIEVTTGRLEITGGARIFSNSGITSPSGPVRFGGSGGDILINASESVDVFGNLNIEKFRDVPLASGVSPSNIESNTFSEAPAGNVTIKAPSLQVREGARIASATFSQGSGGSVQVDSNKILLSGVGGESNEIISGIFSNSGASPQARILNGGLAFSDLPNSNPSIGTGGEVRINTNELLIQDLAEVSVGSFEQGMPGNINVQADSILISQQGGLTATSSTDQGGDINISAKSLSIDNARVSSNSRGGNGGNLTFSLKDFLLLRNRGLVLTEAGTDGAGGNGGDININLLDGFIVAAPSENSDIRANAFEGNGGNITINSLGLLGITFRPRVLDTPESDITSSSQLGNSGIVTINSPETDIDTTSTQLSEDLSPPPVKQSCQAEQIADDTFVVSGRGGLPENPVALTAAGGLWQDIDSLEDLNLNTGKQLQPPTDSKSVAQQSQQKSSNLIEAQSWSINSKGNIELISLAPSSTSLSLETEPLCTPSTS